MKHTLEISEREIKAAMLEKLESQGYDVKSIELRYRGYPESEDPRERAIEYYAKAGVAV